MIARPSSFVPKGDGGVRAMVVVEHTARPLLNWMVSRLVDTVRGDKIFLARANAKDSAAQVRHVCFCPQATFVIAGDESLKAFSSRSKSKGEMVVLIGGLHSGRPPGMCVACHSHCACLHQFLCGNTLFVQVSPGRNTLSHTSTRCCIVQSSGQDAELRPT